VRRALVVLVVVALLAVGGYFAFRPASGSGGGAAGGRAGAPPPLPARALIGAPVTLADLRGKPALVNFWAAWCGPCKREAPELRALAREVRGRAAIVGVDWNDNSGNARAFARSHGLTYPLLSDPGGQVGDDWGIRGLPTTFVLDAEGHVTDTLRGPQSLVSFRQALLG
jgi:cytochrome c biogenesis protein CcmG/thiol:disulfide interchange protein DsbE